jgi:hypothetical protein
MLPDQGAIASEEVRRLEAELREGRLESPPPLPEK